MSENTGELKKDAFSFTADVPARYMHKVRGKFNEVNNKLRKKGLPPFKMEVGELKTAMIQVQSEDRLVVQVPVSFYQVEVKGSPFDFGPYRARGWADLSKTPMQLHDVSGKISEEEIQRLYCAECDQCKTKRDRQKMFLVDNIETGQSMQVGGECAKDIFNGFSPDKVASTLSVVAVAYEIEEMMRNGGTEYEESLKLGMREKGENGAIKVRDFVALTIDHLKRTPFVSKSGAKERGLESTTAVVESIYRSRVNQNQAVDQNLLDEADRTIDLLGATLREKSSLSDMETNIEQLSRYKDSFVSSEYAGFLAYMPVMLDRMQQNLADRDSKHLGRPAEKTSMLLQYLDTARYDSMYGPGYRHSFADDEGNALVMFSSVSQGGFGFVKKGWVQADFQIKDHTEFRGVKQTQVKSMKVRGQWDFKPDEAALKKGVRDQEICNMLWSSTQKAAKFMKKEALEINDNVQCRSDAFNAVAINTNTAAEPIHVLERWRLAGIKFDDLTVSKHTAFANYCLNIGFDEKSFPDEVSVAQCVAGLSRYPNEQESFGELIAMCESEQDDLNNASNENLDADGQDDGEDDYHAGYDEVNENIDSQHDFNDSRSISI